MKKLVKRIKRGLSDDYELIPEFELGGDTGDTASGPGSGGTDSGGEFGPGAGNANANAGTEGNANAVGGGGPGEDSGFFGGQTSGFEGFSGFGGEFGGEGRGGTDSASNAFSGQTSTSGTEGPEGEQGRGTEGPDTATTGQTGQAQAGQGGKGGAQTAGSAEAAQTAAPGLSSFGFTSEATTTALAGLADNAFGLGLADGFGKGWSAEAAPGPEAPGPTAESWESAGKGPGSALADQFGLSPDQVGMGKAGWAEMGLNLGPEDPWGRAENPLDYTAPGRAEGRAAARGFAALSAPGKASPQSEEFQNIVNPQPAAPPSVVGFYDPGRASIVGPPGPVIGLTGPVQAELDMFNPDKAFAPKGPEVNEIQTPGRTAQVGKGTPEAKGQLENTKDLIANMELVSAPKGSPTERGAFDLTAKDFAIQSPYAPTVTALQAAINAYTGGKGLGAISTTSISGRDDPTHGRAQAIADLGKAGVEAHGSRSTANAMAIAAAQAAAGREGRSAETASRGPTGQAGLTANPMAEQVAAQLAAENTIAGLAGREAPGIPGGLLDQYASPTATVGKGFGPDGRASAEARGAAFDMAFNAAMQPGPSGAPSTMSAEDVAAALAGARGPTGPTDESLQGMQPGPSGTPSALSADQVAAEIAGARSAIAGLAQEAPDPGAPEDVGPDKPAPEVDPERPAPELDPVKDIERDMREERERQAERDRVAFEIKGRQQQEEWDRQQQILQNVVDPYVSPSVRGPDDPYDPYTAPQTVTTEDMERAYQTLQAITDPYVSPAARGPDDPYEPYTAPPSPYEDPEIAAKEQSEREAARELAARAEREPAVQPPAPHVVDRTGKSDREAARDRNAEAREEAQYMADILAAARSQQAQEESELMAGILAGARDQQAQEEAQYMADILSAARGQQAQEEAELQGRFGPTEEELDKQAREEVELQRSIFTLPGRDLEQKDIVSRPVVTSKEPPPVPPVVTPKFNVNPPIPTPRPIVPARPPAARPAGRPVATQPPSRGRGRSAQAPSPGRGRGTGRGTAGRGGRGAPGFIADPFNPYVAFNPYGGGPGTMGPYSTYSSGGSIGSIGDTVIMPTLPGDGAKLIRMAAGGYVHPPEMHIHIHTGGSVDEEMKRGGSAEKKKSQAGLGPTPVAPAAGPDPAAIDGIRQRYMQGYVQGKLQRQKLEAEKRRFAGAAPPRPAVPGPTPPPMMPAPAAQVPVPPPPNAPLIPRRFQYGGDTQEDPLGYGWMQKSAQESHKMTEQTAHNAGYDEFSLDQRRQEQNEPQEDSQYQRGGSLTSLTGSNTVAKKPPGVSLVHSAVSGRTDRIPMQARTGSYVLPADVVSGLGEGNTYAGAKMWGEVLKAGSGPYGVSAGITPIRTARMPTAKLAGRMPRMSMPRAAAPKKGKMFQYGGSPHEDRLLGFAPRSDAQEGDSKYKGFETRPIPPYGSISGGTGEPTTIEGGVRRDGLDASGSYTRPAYPGEKPGVSGRIGRSWQYEEGGDTDQGEDDPGFELGVGDDEQTTPIIVSGGELIIDPEIVEALGEGDPERGKEILENAVLMVRKQVVAAMKQLPDPVT